MLELKRVPLFIKYIQNDQNISATLLGIGHICVNKTQPLLPQRRIVKKNKQYLLNMRHEMIEGIMIIKQHLLKLFKVLDCQTGAPSKQSGLGHRGYENPGRNKYLPSKGSPSEKREAYHLREKEIVPQSGQQLNLPNEKSVFKSQCYSVLAVRI